MAADSINAKNKIIKVSILERYLLLRQIAEIHEDNITPSQIHTHNHANQTARPIQIAATHATEGSHKI
jgi:hypothetical protein